MKRFKKILILLGVLVVACIATFCVFRYEEKQEQIRNSDEIVLEIPTESVQSLSWEYEETSLAFHRDEVWLYDGDEAFQVDEEKINGLLEQFQEFGVSFIIEEVEDYGQYGLEEPICTIHLETEEESYEITLGNFSNLDQERYVSIGDGNVYLVKHDPLDEFDAVLSDLIDHDETPYFEQVQSVQFSGAEDYSILYAEDSADTYCPDDVYFAQLDGSSLPLDTGRVNTYLRNISYLDPTDYVSYNVTGEELAAWGLDAPELTIQVDYSYLVYADEDDEEGEEAFDTFVLHVGLNQEEKAAVEEAEAEAAESEEEVEIPAVTCYVRVGDSQIVYEVSQSDHDTLLAASYDALRHQEVLTASFDEVTGMEISLEGETYTISSEIPEDSEEEDPARVYYYREQELDLSGLQSALEDLSANSFTEEEPTGKEEICVTVYLDNENYPQVQVQLYRYSGEECLAVIDGKPISLIPRAQAVALIEAVHTIVLNDTGTS